MQNCDTFASFHPLVGFLYFALVLVFSMCFMHPVCLAISLASALLYSLCLRGKRAAKLSLFFLLPMALMAIILNPAFNHEGATLICYLPSGNPLTLESIVYGAAAAAMLCAVIAWFSCFNEVISSDKFVYLFGRIIPALSLVLSMALRFVPRFAGQLRAASRSRRGLKGETAGFFAKIREGVTVFSAVVTWSLENAIETADSMAARGYGLPGRTAFSVFRFDGRDRAAFLWLGLCGAYIIYGWAAGYLGFRYYPTIKPTQSSGFALCFMLAYLALCLTPLIIDLKEDAKWKRLRSEA